MKNFKKRLEHAKHYIAFGVKEGFFDPDEYQFEKMSDRQLIEWAEDREAFEDARAESLHDEDLQEAMQAALEESIAGGN